MEITGSRIRLRPMRADDIEARVRWLNDPQVNETLFIDESLELEKSRVWFEKAAQSDTRRDFIIEALNGVPIGCTGLVGIDRRHQTAECYCVIGEKDYWQKGIGTEVHRVLIDWAFRTLGLHKIWAAINAGNAAVIKLTEKLGFKIEGTLRQEKLMAGKRVDVVRIGLLRDEFYKANPELTDAGISDFSKAESK